MSFGIASYRLDLERRLKELPERYRIAFSAWCAQFLFERSIVYVASKVNEHELLLLHRALQFVWNCASGVEDLKRSAAELLADCNRIAWNSDAIRDDEQAANMIAIVALSGLVLAIETCVTGSHETAARSAEQVINKLDYQLSAKHRTRSYCDAIFSDTLFKEELERQKKMVDYLLRESPQIGEEIKSKFRP